MKRLTLLLLVVAGCDSCGDNDHGNTDANVPDTMVVVDASIDAPEQMGTVTASATVRYLTEAGEVTGPAQNLVLIDSANTTIQPTVGTNNTLTFSGVAPGPYLICDVSLSTRHVCTVASAPDINLDYYQAGRPDAVLGGPSTTLVLTVNGATSAPAGTNEFLDVRAVNTNYVEYPAPPTTATPLVTALSFNGRGLLQAGDVLRVTQLIAKMSGGDEYVAAARSGSVTGVTMTNNTANAAAVTLGTTLAQTGSVTFNLRRSQFNSLGGSAGPGATWLGCEINGWSEAKPYGWKPWTFWYPRTSATTDKSLTFTYGNPAPSNSQTFEVACASALTLTAPAATTGVPITVYAAAYRPVAELTGDINPAISRPTAVKINGMDAATALTGTTTTPTVSWTAPATGTPTRYTVFVYRLINTGGSTLATVSGQFSTTGTTFKIPPGYIQGSDGYAITVRAEAIPGYDATKPFSPIARYELADTSTAALTP